MRASGQIHWNLSFFLFSAVGVTNQRETTLVWDKDTGEPLYNAIGESVSISIFGFLHRCQTHRAVKKVDCVMWETTRGMTWLHQVEASCVVSVPAPPKTIRAVIQQQPLPLTQAFSLKSQFISELFSPLIRLGGVVSAVHWSEHCLSYEQPTKASKVCFFFNKMLVLNFSQQEKRHRKAIFFKRCVTFILFNQVLGQKVNADVFMWLFYV